MSELSKGSTNIHSKIKVIVIDMHVSAWQNDKGVFTILLSCQLH